MGVYGDPMLRPRARLGPAPVVDPVLRPLPALAASLVLGLLLAVAGCGSNGDRAQSGDRPDEATTSCRQEWKELAKKVQGRDKQTNPSALAARWNTVSATIDYYATSASEKDCGKTLASQQKAMEALRSFGARLARYDMELRLDQVRSEAEKYAAGPRPPAPKASKASKGKKKQRPPRAPRPADVAAALKTLTRQAPVSARQQQAGWEQALVAELGDAAAVKKTVKDLSFLSNQSRAYRICVTELALVRKALSAKPR